MAGRMHSGIRGQHATVVGTVRGFGKRVRDLAGKPRA